MIQTRKGQFLLPETNQMAGVYPTTLQGAITYTTLGKEKSSTQKCRLVGGMLVPVSLVVVHSKSIFNKSKCEDTSAGKFTFQIHLTT